MAIISATRLRLKSAAYLLPFFWHVFKASRQTAAAPGFLGGRLFWDRRLVFWTVTAWQDCRTMRGFQTSGAHRQAMPQLARWCNEGSTAHWETDSSRLPAMEEAYRRMCTGKFIALPVSSPMHQLRQIPKPHRALWRGAMTRTMELLAGLVQEKKNVPDTLHLENLYRQSWPERSSNENLRNRPVSSEQE
ncbi:hypothetical protein [Gloeobacter morelensis]|uniref:DUF3291 domain-containing protein n=1 Tax=Gloeobacter morelensis MG652769 TaxID=2781736 RepID=A0ABY3PRK0_9CYAN|nr:hypothetical protein [Gloeobacter morelensis]UFP96332.1 hypothetical protein ISF26_09025 [Gloeobacter morelensis MG652769]